ncbi:PAS domain-containing protein [Streptomyces malaysiensis subsp. malaysiensis]|uniref:PAS domain-containing protein n=1 Tax=Streptomyces malaysiensis TaxID=92644 RepID=A0ABX6W6H3_STRMQ|nr:PAS domain-containing protein [Streptomyces solisilvae]
MSASQRSESAQPAPSAQSSRGVPGQPGAAPSASGRPDRPDGPERPDSELLAALLDGMDAALCAFDADGTVTHWNHEAERILGWTAAEAVGRKGLGGWAARPGDARDVEERLTEAMGATGRRVHEFALLTKDGGRVLVRTQSSRVPGVDGRPAGVYCAFSEVHAQVDLERSIALSEALLADASWNVVLVDADLRVAVANTSAAGALHTTRRAAPGRPLGDFLDQGVEEAEAALQHVLAEGAPPAPTELWVTVRDADRADAADGFEGAEGVRYELLDDDEAVRGEGADRGETGAAARRRCWRSGFLRLVSPLTEEPAPLGVAWIFQDATEAKGQEQESARMRFRGNQLHRAARAAAECEDPMEAASIHLDFALAGFADHALIDLVLDPPPGTPADRIRLVRAAATPTGTPGPCPPVVPGGIPLAYPEGHPALQAVERCGSVRASTRRSDEQAAAQWAAARKWPEGAVHGLCAVLRSRGRTLGVVTFLRTSSRRAFDRTDAAYAEDVAARVAASVDLAVRRC